MYIHWDGSLETGHPLVDAEHRLLVLLFRKLDVAIKTRQSADALGHIVREVVRCVEFHFLSEENLMRETGYAGLEAHRSLHAELLLELNAYVDKIAHRREYPEDLLSFLSDWLSQHIAQHDRRVVQHVGTSPLRPIAELAYPEYLGAAPAPGTKRG
ncbi:MAG: hemerythrin family protein [Burkholderiales bacterium]|nr:hemerythrin family protein [Burkholderiales bacterium]MDE2565405.1 hemerythrin family protein [Burkholderiales bacterium]